MEKKKDLACSILVVGCYTFEEIPLQEECELGFNRNCFQFSDVTVIDFNLKYMHYITVRERNIFQRRFKVPLLTGGLFLRQVEG